MDRTSRRSTSTRGFTLLEVGIVIAIIGILAAAAAVTMRSARRNASVGSTAFDLVLRLQGLKTEALSEQKTIVAVLVNPEGDVSTSCGVLTTNKCLRLYVLIDPSSAWTLGGFNPSSPGTNVASVKERESLPAGVALDVGAAGTAAQAPFASVTQLATSVTGTCDGGKCIAVRFEPSGEVRPVYAGSSTPTLKGISFGLTSDAASGPGGAERRAVLVSFPTGIVKSFGY